MLPERLEKMLKAGQKAGPGKLWGGKQHGVTHFCLLGFAFPDRVSQ